MAKGHGAGVDRNTAGKQGVVARQNRRTASGIPPHHAAPRDRPGKRLRARGVEEAQLSERVGEGKRGGNGETGARKPDGSDSAVARVVDRERAGRTNNVAGSKDVVAPIRAGERHVSAQDEVVGQSARARAAARHRAARQRERASTEGGIVGKRHHAGVYGETTVESIGHIAKGQRSGSRLGDGAIRHGAADHIASAGADCNGRCGPGVDCKRMAVKIDRVLQRQVAPRIIRHPRLRAGERHGRGQGLFKPGGVRDAHAADALDRERRGSGDHLGVGSAQKLQAPDGAARILERRILGRAAGVEAHTVAAARHAVLIPIRTQAPNGGRTAIPHEHRLPH